MRLFFAVLLPEEILARISEIQRELRLKAPDPGIKWTKPEQLHLTVKFLGETPPEKLEKVLQVGQAVREGKTGFPVKIEGLGAFPNARRPSTLWLGITEGHQALAEIALQLDEILVKYGYRKENRSLTPHLTLARVKSYSAEVETARLLNSSGVGIVDSATIDRFVLMRSALKATGSEYSVVEEFPFSP